jgi:hypothetical protein
VKTGRGKVEIGKAQSHQRREEEALAARRRKKNRKKYES